MMPFILLLPLWRSVMSIESAADLAGLRAVGAIVADALAQMARHVAAGGTTGAPDALADPVLRAPRAGPPPRRPPAPGRGGGRPPGPSLPPAGGPGGRGARARDLPRPAPGPPAPRRGRRW